ncbi:hypothetical protein ABZ719_31800 [Streptomyces sp. NPDC006743]|uniref:hypothetical protein n=1 Tax=Streptomyces sp. NPDC006743 TaxID=3154480 RepID=UPI003455A7C1
MKIRPAATAALVAASALAALAPSQAFAAPQAPPCTKKNIAYLDAQNHHEDAEAKVTASEQALDRAKADRAKVDHLGKLAEGLENRLRWERSERSLRVADKIQSEQSVLDEAVWKHDAVASAEAAVKLADATDRAFKDEGDTEGHVATEHVKALREGAEKARSATEAPNVEARQADLDAARTELTKAAKAVRPARDAYRDCLDKLVS